MAVWKIKLSDPSENHDTIIVPNMQRPKFGCKYAMCIFDISFLQILSCLVESSVISSSAHNLECPKANLPQPNKMGGCCTIATITVQCTDISCLWRQNHETVLGTQNLSSERRMKMGHVWHWRGEGPTVRPSHSEKGGLWVNQRLVGGPDEGLHQGSLTCLTLESTSLPAFNSSE